MTFAYIKVLAGSIFRDIEGFNKALIAKQTWRIQTNLDSLIARFLSILDAELGKHPSYLWKSLLWGRELICKGLRYRIGNGKDTYMFKDPWIPKEFTFKPICIDRDMFETKVADYISPSGGWDIEKLNTAVINFDINTIRGIPINTNLNDKLICHFDKTGKYTVKSGYKLYMKIKINGVSSSSSPLNRVWNNLWKLKIPAKIKHFCWRALKDSIPNSVNLNHRGINVSVQCPICNSQLENIDHCLFDCPRAREIWKLTYNNVFLEEGFHGCFIDRWVKIDACSSQKDLSLAAVTYWTIWTDINKFVHGESIPPSQVRSNWIKEYLDSFWKANANDPRSKFVGSKTIASSSRNVYGLLPSDGFWLLNTDAACSSLRQDSGLGALIRDKNGKIVAASSNFLDYYMDPLMAELKAILEGLSLALSMGCLNIKVVTDCQMASNFITKKAAVWSEVEALVEEIWSLMGQFHNIDFHYIPRLCNVSGDSLAKYACDLRDSMCWVDHFPSWLCNLVFDDLLSFAQVA